MANKKRIDVESSATAAKFPIIGTCASAGGLEAHELFLKNVPKNSTMSFVIVQHPYPTQKDYMVELLSRTTTMNVYQIEDGICIEPNFVYVISPNKDISINTQKFLYDITINPIVDDSEVIHGVSTALVNTTETASMFSPEFLEKV